MQTHLPIVFSILSYYLLENYTLLSLIHLGSLPIFDYIVWFDFEEIKENHLKSALNFIWNLIKKSEKNRGFKEFSFRSFKCVFHGLDI